MTQYIDREEVISLAKSSALELNEDLLEEYCSSLNEVIGVMQEAIVLDTTDVILEASVPHMVGPEDLRDDLVTAAFSRDEFLNNVPESLGGLVKVPTVIK